jgi:hypothetical protein
MQTSQLLLVIVGDLDATLLKARITAALANCRGTYKPPAHRRTTFQRLTVDITSRELPTNYIRVCSRRRRLLPGYLSDVCRVVASARSGV